MRRPSTTLAIAAIAAHHGIELRAGIGVPGEPVLGRLRATRLWAGTFATHLAAAGVAGQVVDRLLAVANGAYQALAVQHYVGRRPELRLGVPMLAEVDDVPSAWLPAYNLALLTAIVATTIGSATECRSASARWHLLGLLTLPAQHASARHHLAWHARRRGPSS